MAVKCVFPMRLISSVSRTTSNTPNASCIFVNVCVQYEKEICFRMRDGVRGGCCSFVGLGCGVPPGGCALLFRGCWLLVVDPEK